MYDTTFKYIKDSIDLAWGHNQRFRCFPTAVAILRQLHTNHQLSHGSRGWVPHLFPDGADDSRSAFKVNVFQMYCLFWQGVATDNNHGVSARHIMKAIHQVWACTPEAHAKITEVVGQDFDPLDNFPREDFLCYAAVHAGFRVARNPVTDDYYIFASVRDVSERLDMKPRHVV